MVERTPSKGSHSRAITASYFCIATPWGMESSRKKWYKWVEFAVFHIGIGLAIFLSFYISFSGPEWSMAGVSLNFFQIVFLLSFLITVIRLGRRMFSPVNKAISHPDDYFSIAMMVVWFGIATLFLFEQTNTLYMGLFLATTAFLIAYVPFSKMSHYIMWPFTRYYFGKHFGHRGVYPKVNTKKY